VSLKKAFGTHLKQLRKERHITQEQLAERTGVADDRTIRAWEAGEDLPSADHLETLCKELNVTIRELFDFDYP
jgi:transcriptional regulator with XRE-family HTH domain